MSKIKNYDRALYKSDFDAVVGFVKDSYLHQYDFNVCSAKGLEDVLGYLCINHIPHTYNKFDAIDGLSLISIVFGDNVEYSYSFWCNLKEE
jgi:hypothetical protein